jgi:hypothetical protein
VGLLFEAANYTRIDFVRRSVSDMSRGEDTLPPYAAWACRVFTPAQLMDPTVSGPEADPDGDGFSNSAEFTAGTEPLNRNSARKLKLSLPLGRPTVVFEARSNKTYTVQSTAFLDDANWQREVDFCARPSNFISPMQVELANGSRFFRLVTPQLGL